MPLTKSGKQIKEGMEKSYKNKKEGDAVFYSMINAKKPGTKKWEKGKKK